MPSDGRFAVPSPQSSPVSRPRPPQQHLAARRATVAACATRDHPDLLAIGGAGGTAHTRNLGTENVRRLGPLRALRSQGLYSLGRTECLDGSMAGRGIVACPA